MRGNRAGNVPARMQVSDVERSRAVPQILLETLWQEELQVVRQMVRKVGEHVHVHPVWRPRGRRRQPRRVITGIRRADRDVMAAPREPTGEAVSQPRYAAVRPGVGEIGRDMKDSHRCPYNNSPVIDED